MLKHEDNPQPQSASEVRVKTEEFAHAVASLEARKAEELRRLEGTVALGQAVSDLQLELTPEELLAEVERNRREDENKRLSRMRPKDFVSSLPGLKFSWGVIIFVAVLSFLMGWFLKPIPLQYSIPVPATNVTQPSPVPMPFLATQIEPGTVLLSSIADGQEVHCTRDELVYPPGPADFLVNPNLAVDNNASNDWVWGAVKYGGVLYVHGWVLGIPSKHLLKKPTLVATSPLAFAGQNSPQEIPHPITFRADKAHFASEEIQPGKWETLRVEGIKLDKHANEKW